MTKRGQMYFTINNIRPYPSWNSLPHKALELYLPAPMGNMMNIKGSQTIWDTITGTRLPVILYSPLQYIPHTKAARIRTGFAVGIWTPVYRITVATKAMVLPHFFCIYLWM